MILGALYFIICVLAVLALCAAAATGSTPVQPVRAKSSWPRVLPINEAGDRSISDADAAQATLLKGTPNIERAFSPPQCNEFPRDNAASSHAVPCFRASLR
jgi:hypothetical protein